MGKTQAVGKGRWRGSGALHKVGDLECSNASREVKDLRLKVSNEDVLGGIPKGDWVGCDDVHHAHMVMEPMLILTLILQLVHSLIFCDLFSVSLPHYFVFFPFWYCLCHHHSTTLLDSYSCAYDMFQIYFP